MMLTNNYSLYTDNNSGTRVYSEYIKMNAMFTGTKYISYNKSIDENEYQRGECNILHSCILFTTVITLNRNKLLSNSEEHNELLIKKYAVPIYFCCSVEAELKICTTSHLKYGIKLNRAHRVMTRTLKDEAEPALHRSVSQQPIAQSVSFLSSFAAFLQPSFAVSHMTLLPQARAIISFASVSLT